LQLGEVLRGHPGPAGHVDDALPAGPARAPQLGADDLPPQRLRPAPSEVDDSAHVGRLRPGRRGPRPCLRSAEPAATVRGANGSADRPPGPGNDEALRAPDLKGPEGRWCPEGDLNPHALYGH